LIEVVAKLKRTNLELEGENHSLNDELMKAKPDRTAEFDKLIKKRDTFNNEKVELDYISFRSAAC